MVNNMEEQVEKNYLNELMNIHPEDMNNQQKQNFIKELKIARLIMPMEITSNLDLENLTNVKVGETIKFDEGLRFKPFRIKNDDGEVALPLFTDDKHLQKSKIVTHVMVMYTSDIANMLKSLTNEFDEIVLNVASEYSIAMSVHSFIELFDDNYSEDIVNDQYEEAEEVDPIIKEVINALQNDYIEMPAPTVLYYREEKPYMFEDAEDGVYSTIIPFNMHIYSDFNIEMKIVNKLLIPQGTKILYIGNMVNTETHYPFIIAPLNHFRFIEKEDENTYVWEWIGEDFY